MKGQGSDWQVRVIRSNRRKRTISAEVKEGVLVVRAPAAMTDAQLQPHIDSLRRRLQKQARRRKPARGDAELTALAERLNLAYFDGKLSWESVRFVGNMEKRFGSCTPARGTIRISDRLAAMPGWVLEYVLVHELAHLLEANHGPRFWELANRYPLSERARGFLMGAGFEEDGGE